MTNDWIETRSLAQVYLERLGWNQLLEQMIQQENLCEREMHERGSLLWLHDEVVAEDAGRPVEFETLS